MRQCEVELEVVVLSALDRGGFSLLCSAFDGSSEGVMSSSLSGLSRFEG